MLKFQHIYIANQMQITAHLDIEQIEKVLNVLDGLKNAVIASLEADEGKQQENIRIYNKLTGEITISFRNLRDIIYNQRYILNKKIMNQAQEREEVKEIGQKLQDRNDSRQFILDRVKEAQQLLNDNLDRIARW